MGIVVAVVVVVLGVLLYNDSKRDTCREEGKEPSGGLIVSCKDSTDEGF